MCLRSVLFGSTVCTKFRVNGGCRKAREGSLALYAREHEIDCRENFGSEMGEVTDRITKNLSVNSCKVLGHDGEVFVLDSYHRIELGNGVVIPPEIRSRYK